MQDLKDPKPTALQWAAAVPLLAFAIAIYPPAWFIAAFGVAEIVRDALKGKRK